MIKKTVLVPSTSASLQATLGAEAYTAEGQFLLEEHTLNKEKTVVYQAGICG
jgi:hypothetical protein